MANFDCFVAGIVHVGATRSIRCEIGGSLLLLAQSNASLRIFDHDHSKEPWPPAGHGTGLVNLDYTGLGNVDVDRVYLCEVTDTAFNPAVPNIAVPTLKALAEANGGLYKDLNA